MSRMAVDIRLCRAYDDSDGVGYRVLVDRLWPRGIKKEALDIAEWDKDVAPSNELRKDFHSGGLDFEDFSARYRGELDESDAPAQLMARFAESDKRVLVLVYGAKDEEQNHARVLAEHLRDMG